MILKYLLDTCVISELVKTAPNSKVLAWIERQADVDLYLSAVTVGEIRKGIEVARPKNSEAAQRYEAWLEELIAHYGGRIVAFDEPAAQEWGAFMARCPKAGIEDAQIAAIASASSMTVVTRNVGDFKNFSVEILDPF